ncbi:acyl-CoA dehydrogenase family protein [Mesorhizobium retamae]|uniref:Acyl-CoA dehydrogenase family protein n=1 Tax=Mesorhizobium retamae TaxID=2912854 RepID=A0ABS9QD85_9HYPH|nr:acyl-CoA dehydrogenase family protein [Mesorhizobium sp. IRAMC:0171]
MKSYEALRREGITGLAAPARIGGQGGDLLTQCIAIEELSRVCATTGLTLMTCWSFADSLIAFGRDEHLAAAEEVARGSALGSWCYTEPQGGSDLSGARTRASRHGSQWRLDGTKRFITNAGWSDWYLVLARTEGDSFGVFLVNRHDKGITFGKPESKMGMRGSPTCDVYLEECLIPEWRALGDPAKGLEIASASLVESRCHVAVQALGIAQGALDEAVSYTKERNQFGRPIANFQLVRGMIADLTVKVESSRALLYQAAGMVHMDRERARAFSSMAKLLCSDTAMAVTTDAVQLHGGYGYMEGSPVERMMRDAKITQIYEGTNQVQRLIIAKHMLGGSSRA